MVEPYWVVVTESRPGVVSRGELQELEDDLRAEGFAAKAYDQFPAPSRLPPGTSAVAIFIGWAAPVGTVGAIAGGIVGKVIDRYRRRPPDAPSPTVVIYAPDNEELARVKVTPQG